jgi:hypothetical protein
MEWSESGSTFQSGKRHTPHKPIGGHTIKDVSPTVFGVDDDKTYKKVQNNGGGALYYQVSTLAPSVARVPSAQA